LKADSPTPKKGFHLTLRARENLYGYAFVMIWIVGFVILPWFL